jgi:superoxide dismutase, Fe-Mn family
MSFSLPELPYAYDALAPYMSRETIEYHHDKHHLAYVDNGNKLAKGTEWENKPVEEIVKGTFGKNQGLFNNAGQHYNHIHFWKWMKPGGGGDKIPGELEKKITADLGSVAKMKEEFIQAGITQFGSGWCWLAVEDGKIVVMKTLNGENPSCRAASPFSAVMSGSIPIISITATDGPTTSMRSSITWSIGNTWPKCTGRPRNNDQRAALVGDRATCGLFRPSRAFS